MKMVDRLFVSKLTVFALLCVHCVVNIGCVTLNRTSRQASVLCCLPNPYWDRSIIQYASGTDEQCNPVAVVCSVLSGWRDAVPHKMMLASEETVDSDLLTKLNMPIVRAKERDLREIFVRLAAIKSLRSKSTLGPVATFSIWLEGSLPIVYTLGSVDMEQFMSMGLQGDLMSWLDSLTWRDMGCFDCGEEHSSSDTLLDEMRMRVLLGGGKMDLITPMEPTDPDPEVGGDVLAIMVCQMGHGYAVESVIAIDSEALAYAMKSVGLWQGEAREYVVSHRLMDRVCAALVKAGGESCGDGDRRYCIVFSRDEGIKVLTTTIPRPKSSEP